MLHEFFIFQIYGKDANHLGDWHRREDSIKTDIKEISWGGAEWIA